jgi:signal transduction histidine kinase/ActR/RegA family two-component response regulator
VRRLATLDKLLLATLVPLWTAVFALHVRQVVLTGLAEPPVYAWESSDPDGYPVVGAYRPQLHGRETALAIGDRLLRVGRVDLRGASYLRFFAATLAETDAALEVPLTFERGGERHTLMLAMRRPAIAWYWIPALLGTAITAVLVLLRAPDVAQARLFFAAVMTFIIFCTPFHGQSYGQSYVSRGVFWYGLGGVGFGLVWLWVICFPGEVPRRDRISPAWALLASAVWYASRINYVTPGLPAAIVPAFKGTCDAFLMGGGLAIATRNYRLAGPIGRRRVKWLLYGAYVAIVPLILARALTFLDPDAWWYEWFYLATVIGMAGFPLGTLVAIVRYNLFDIDRLISATASYSLVLVVLVGLLLAVAPTLAHHASAAMGMDATLAQVLSTLAIAALVVPLGGRLRALIERVFFAERHAFERGMQQVLRDLSTCTEPGEVTALLAERIAALLRPERLVLYAGTGDGFAPAFAWGVEAPPRVAASGALVSRLAHRPAPVAVLDPPADGAPLAPYTSAEAAALEGTAIAVRLHRGGDMTAFVCLGPKRSGDVYTSTDVNLLAAVAEKASSELLRFRDAEIIRRGQAQVESLRAEKEDAHRSNVAKSRFLAAASHDLRQPLHALGLLAGALDDRVHDPGARELVAQIQRSTRALEDTFDALLDISRLDAGAVDVSVSDVRLDPLLTRLAHDFEAQAALKGVRLRNVGSRLVVRTDPVLLWRILQNLLSNAIRYTDHGCILVGCRRRGERVRIDVLDTGRGIPPDRRRVIFEEFRRCEDDPRRAHEGLGLGLAIVERLARLLGHDIEVESTVGRGSRFSVTLVRGRPADAAPWSREARPGADLAGTSVLIVDDDAAARDATRRQLEQWGCAVRAAASAAQACEPDALAVPPHVIVASDRLADGATGLDAIAAIRAALGRPVPALVVTGAATADILARVRASGLPLLPKPVAPAKLRALLTQLVRWQVPTATRPPGSE